MAASASIRFPYLTKVIDEGKIPDPRASIRVETLHGLRTIKFLIDSGADTTVLPLAPYGPWFRVDVNSKNKTEIGGIGDEKIYGYTGKIKILLGDDSFWIRCVFVESGTIPLLGRLDLWNRYSLIFDNYKKESVLEKWL